MSWISTRELVARGVPRSAIETAIAERKLKGTRLSSDEMAFNVDVVDAWLAGKPAGVNAPTAKQGLADYRREEQAALAREQAARAAARPAAVSPASAADTAVASPTRRSAVETLENLVAHNATQENVTEYEARKRVLRDCPDLRQRLWGEANANGPERGRARSREDLRARAAALALPRFGAPVD